MIGVRVPTVVMPFPARPPKALAATAEGRLVAACMSRPPGISPAGRSLFGAPLLPRTA